MCNTGVSHSCSEICMDTHEVPCWTNASINGSIVLLVHMLSNIHGMCTRAEHVSLVSSAYVVTTTCTLSDTLREQ